MKEYKELQKGFPEKQKIKEFIAKNPDRAFPGVADLLEKEENEHADYIIFHEIMKFMEEKNTDAIFLTFDTTKGDWMKGDKHPLLHYVHNCYLNTGKLLFILDADRTLNDVLKISIEPLLDEESFESIFIGLWNDLVSIASSAAIEKGISTDYYTNPDMRKIFIELIESKYIGEELLADIEEVMYFRNAISQGRSNTLYQLPIKEKKRVLNSMNYLVHALEIVTYGPVTTDGSYICARCKQFTMGIEEDSNVCSNCGYIDPDY